MVWAAAKEYPGLPDPGGMDWHQVRFWYEGIREDLKHSAAEAAKTRK